MGILDSVKSMFGGSGASESVRAADRVYVVDAEKLADSREGRTGPVERFRAIQQLSRFSEREKVEIVAVVGGRPLREVAHGESFNGVKVFYVEEGQSLADRMEKCLGEVRRKPVVITNDKQLETRMNERGISTLRVSTLRKAFEGGEGGGERGERGERGGDRGDRGGRDRRPRRNGRPDRPQRQDSNAEGTSAGDAAEPADQGQPTDTVDGLIDRVN